MMGERRGKRGEEQVFTKARSELWCLLGVWLGAGVFTLINNFFFLKTNCEKNKETNFENVDKNSDKYFRNKIRKKFGTDFWKKKMEKNISDKGAFFSVCTIWTGQLFHKCHKLAR